MSLTPYIEDCGGVENIARVLVPDERLIFEVRNPALLQRKIAGGSFNDTLSQITYRSFPTPASEELLALGRGIARHQLAMAEDFIPPVECDYRPQWHVSPPKGLLNDPNGFIYHNGEYHLFYQWYPFSCAHKDKHWAHLTSTDLINWQWQPVPLTPSDWFDSHGVFSGHAVSNGEELMLFYTGNVRIDEQRDRHTTQCVAVSKDGIQFEKKGPVIFDLPPQVTPHCRDPKIVRHNNQWLMLLGAQRDDLKGRLAVYKSTDLMNWTFHKLCGDEMGDFGYMWECPDMFELNDQLLAVVGPQGIAAESEHHTIPHHNGIAKAVLSDDGDITLSEFRYLDHGFDFYAPQTLETADGRRVISGWMGLPDEDDHPSVDSGWIHQLTMLREMRFVDGKLLQMPIEEMKSLRGDQHELNLNNSGVDLQTKSYELTTTLEWGSTLSLFKGEEYQLDIRLDSESRTLFLDRSKTELRQGDKVRELALQDSDQVELQIFADTSSVEIFINQGEFVMSSRVFTPKQATGIALKGQAQLDIWTLNAADKPFAGKMA
jgi:beta-fructofuranosidase